MNAQSRDKEANNSRPVIVQNWSRLMTLKELCLYISASPQTVYRWIKQGLIPAKDPYFKRYDKHLIDQKIGAITMVKNNENQSWKNTKL